jgi:subtilisin family serine protease
MSVEVAIIDSGINPWHSHVQGVAGGIAFRLRAAGEAVADDDFRDGLGHGTAIAGVIREQAPRADLFAVKIFHGELNAPMELLRAALEWVIDRRIKLVHLSLGTVREKNRPVLEALCRQAVDSRIVIVAAAPGSDDAVYPAALDGVIGVYWHRQCAAGQLVYHSDMPIEFGTYGRPRAIPGLPLQHNFSGSSFAAAHVSAMAARFLEANPDADVAQVKHVLKYIAERGFAGS